MDRRNFNKALASVTALPLVPTWSLKTKPEPSFSLIERFNRAAQRLKDKTYIDHEPRPFFTYRYNLIYDQIYLESGMAPLLQTTNNDSENIIYVPIVQYKGRELRHNQGGTSITLNAQESCIDQIAKDAWDLILYSSKFETANLFDKNIYNKYKDQTLFVPETLGLELSDANVKAIVAPELNWYQKDKNERFGVMIDLNKSQENFKMISYDYLQFFNYRTTCICWADVGLVSLNQNQTTIIYHES